MIRRFERLVFGEHPNRGAGGGPPRASYNPPGLASNGIAGPAHDKAVRKYRQKKMQENRQQFRDYASGYGLNKQQADKKYEKIIKDHNKSAMTRANAQALSSSNPGFRPSNPADPSSKVKIPYDPKYGAMTNTRTYSYGGGMLGSLTRLGPVGDMVFGSPSVNVNSFSVYDELAKDHRKNPGSYNNTRPSQRPTQNRARTKPTIKPTRSPTNNPKPATPSPKRSAAATSSPLMRDKRKALGAGGVGTSGGVKLGKRL